MPCRQCEKDNCNGKSLISKGQFRSVFEENYTASTSVQESQEADKDIALVKSWLEANERPSFEDIRSAGYFLKSLWSQWKRSGSELE